jgi:hypothetical protein
METDDVMWYGIWFTSSEYVETKLLKMLNGTHAPHFLFQDVLNIELGQGIETIEAWFFAVSHNIWKAQIKHIEKWQQLHYCQP